MSLTKEIDTVYASVLTASNKKTFESGLSLLILVLEKVEDLSTLSGSNKKEVAKGVVRKLYAESGIDNTLLDMYMKNDTLLDMTIDSLIGLTKKINIKKPKRLFGCC